MYLLWCVSVYEPGVVSIVYITTISVCDIATSGKYRGAWESDTPIHTLLIYRTTGKFGGQMSH